MRLRAAGKPRPGLVERIRRVTGQSQEGRTAAAPPSMVRRRTILLHFGAMAGIAAILMLAPLADVLSDVRQRIDGQAGHETQDAVVAVAADDQDDDVGDADDPDDDVGDADDEDDENEGDDHEDDDDDEDDEEHDDGE